VIVDTSAIVALMLREPRTAEIVGALREAPSLRMSAATYVELCAVVDNRRSPNQRRHLDALLEACQIEIVPFTSEQAQVARDAYRDYGRGSGHKARLNLGDAYSYALAATAKEPLLFVGDDFTHTDLVPALPTV
jgi:ribonuclease VapC